MTWQDDGVTLTVDVSTEGEWIEPMSQFTETWIPGGDRGQPATWTANQSSTDWTRAVMSTNNDAEWSVYASSTNDTNIPYFGGTKIFSVTPGHQYLVGLDVRAYQSRGPASSVLFTIGRIKVGASSPYTYTNVEPYSTTGLPDSTNTFQVVQQLTAKDTQTGELVDRFSIQVYARASRPTGSNNLQWGLIFSNLRLVDTDSVATSNPLTFGTVLCDTMHASIKYGRARFTERYDVGTYVIRLNNIKGDYRYHEDDTGFRPGRICRIRASYKGTTYPLCYGVIDRVQTTVEKDGTATVDLTVLDTTSFTSAATTPSLTPENYGMSATADMFFSGARINALLNFAGIAKSRRAIDPGQWSMQVITQSGRALREEIGITADSEGGAFYGERDGSIVYKDRTWSTVDPHGNTVQAQITAVPADVIYDPQPDEIPTVPNAPVICPSNLETDWSLERVINFIRLAVAGGSTYVFQNTDSQKQYGIKTYQRLDFVNAKQLYSPSPPVKEQLSQRAADMFSTSLKAMLRVYSLTYRPTPDTWVFTLTAFLNWLIRVYYYNPQGDWGFSTVVRIQSVAHTISPKDWVVVMNVDQPIDFNDDLNPLPPSETGWDLGKWDLDIWDDTTSGANWSSGAKWSSGFKWSY